MGLLYIVLLIGGISIVLGLINGLSLLFMSQAEFDKRHNVNANLLIGGDRPGAFVAQSVSVAPNRSAMWAVVGAIALLVVLGSVVNRYAELKAKTVAPVASVAYTDNEFVSANRLCGMLKKMDGIARCETSGERSVTVVMNAANPQELCIGMTTLTTATMRNNGVPPLKIGRAHV